MSGWDRRRGQSRMLETMAAASLGLAVGFASWSLAAMLPLPVRAALAAWLSFSAFLLVARLLNRLADGPRAAAPVIESEFATPSALLLRLQDVLAEASAAERGADELLLDDALPAAEPDSRVVRLFQAPDLPTAGDLQARIDRHLVGRSSEPDMSTDHSDELFEALESLKRSLG